MQRIKIILCGLGIGLIVVGFLMIVYGEIRLNTFYNCTATGCPTSPDWIYETSTIPQIIVYSGLGVMIAGVICTIIGRKKGIHAN